MINNINLGPVYIANQLADYILDLERDLDQTLAELAAERASHDVAIQIIDDLRASHERRPGDYLADAIADSEVVPMADEWPATKPAEKAEPEMVTSWYSEDAFWDWDCANCAHCKKGISVSLEPGWKCDLERGLWYAGPSDGKLSIPADLARRAGLPGGTECPERES